MKTISTKKGKEILVSDTDYDYLNQFMWSVDPLGYARATINKKRVHMHRLILGLTNPKILTDHKNHNKLDNRRENLRECNHSENNKNKISRGKSKYLGVSIRIRKSKNKNNEIKIYNSTKKYRAMIQTGFKNKHIGTFSTEVEAALAYNEQAKKLHGEFTNLNIIE